MASDMFTLRLDDRASALTDLNKRLKSLGRKETVTSINSSSEPQGYINRDIHYRYADGKRSNFKYLQQPTDSPDSLAEKFLTHLCDMEYQQYLDDHKAMTLGSLFGENRFPRARERAFLDFRTQAASQAHYESFDYNNPHSGVVKKVLDAYLTHHLPGLSSIKCDAFATREGGHAIVSLHSLIKWEHCKTIKVPLSQDMPWFTAAQQARDTLRAWIDDAAQKKSETAVAGDDYTVCIWGINYPNARVEYRDGIERVRSVSGFTHGVYKAGAKVIGVPRTDEPFDIVLKYRNGDVVALLGCSWVADGEVCCTSIVKNGKSSFQPEMSVAAAQKIPAGAMVNSDGEVVGKATPARAMAYLNGEPVGFVSSIDYSGIVHLNTDAEGRVTTTAQQVKKAIDRSTAISVPTRDEIKRSLLERVANDGSRKASGVMIDLVAESTHETYKAIAQVAEDARRGFEQSRMRFDNLAGQPLTREGLGHAIGKMRESFDNAFVPSRPHIPLDFAPQIGDDASVSKTLWPTTHELGRMTVQERTVWSACVEHSLDAAKRGGPAPPQDLVAYFKETASMPTLGVNVNDPATLRQRATAEAIEVAYRTAAIKLPDLVRKQLVKRMAAKGGKAKPSQARLSLAEEMLSGDEGSLIVAGILSLALSASPEFIKSKMPWLDINRLATELRLNVETRIACAVADMLGMYLDGALEALKEAFGGSQQLLLAESSKPDESALFNGVPKAESVGVR